MRADLRCRWCGEWLTPEHIADGETYCCTEHAVTSLERQYARPSHHEPSCSTAAPQRARGGLDRTPVPQHQEPTT